MFDLLFYQARANEKLGKKDVAASMFKNLIERGQQQRDVGNKNTLVAVEEASATNQKSISESYLLEALGNMGLGNTEEAKRLLQTALETYKNNLWAKVLTQS
jgi:tetratricopeptide (TPR) repeat protein